METGRVDISIRPVNPRDVLGIDPFTRGLSAASLRLRFMAAVREETARRQFVSEVTIQPDAFAFVAIDHERDDAIVGQAFAAIDVAAKTAEVAFAVDDLYQQQGIGSGLLAALVAEARRRELQSLRADTLPENNLMLAVFRESGLPLRERLEDGVVGVELRLDA